MGAVAIPKVSGFIMSGHELGQTLSMRHGGRQHPDKEYQLKELVSSTNQRVASWRVAIWSGETFSPRWNGTDALSKTTRKLYPLVVVQILFSQDSQITKNGFSQ